MKSLLIIWILAGLTILGCLWYMNHTINIMAQKIQPEPSYVVQRGN